MSNLQLIYPPALAEGGTIAIVSPACHPIDHWIEAAKALFESAGYRVFVHAQNTLRNGQLAGDDQTRAARIDGDVCRSCHRRHHLRAGWGGVISAAG